MVGGLFWLLPVHRAAFLTFISMKTDKIFHLLFCTAVLFFSGWSCFSNPSITESETVEYAKDTIYFTSTYLLGRSDIPDSVFRMKHLRTLSIAGMDCPPPMHQKYIDKNGKVMDSCYSLKAIPLAVGNLRELRVLSLGNDIKEIPPFIKNLAELQVLSLTDNPIRSLPKEIADLKSLRELNLADCPLDSIAYIENLPKLEKLFLHGCPIKKLPNDLSRWTSLRLLGLHRTKIIDKTEQERIRKALPNCRIQFPS